MLTFQRENLVESSDETEDDAAIQLIKDLNHPTILVRVFTLGKMNKTLLELAKLSKLSKLDKYFLKGFYTNSKSEL